MNQKSGSVRAAVLLAVMALAIGCGRAAAEDAVEGKPNAPVAVTAAPLGKAIVATPAVRPFCVNVSSSDKGRSHPVLILAAGESRKVVSWSCAGEDGGVDLTLRACLGAGGACGAHVAQWSADGQCADSATSLGLGVYPQVPARVLTGPLVLEALVRDKSGATKGFAVCLR